MMYRHKEWPLQVGFSIFVPLYNGENYILETLESIKNQTFTNFEIIIIDDSSKDSSVELVETWLRNNISTNARFVKNSSNIGVSKSLQKCMSIADEMYSHFCFFSHDDLMPCDFLEVIASKLSRARNFDKFSICNSPYEYFGEEITSKKVHPILSGVFGEFFLAISLNTNYIAGPGAVVQKGLYRKKFLDGDFHSCQDWQQWLFLQLFGRVTTVNSTSVRYRRHSGNLSSAIKHREQHIESYKMRQAFINSSEFDSYISSRSLIWKSIFMFLFLTSKIDNQVCTHHIDFVRHLSQKMNSQYIEKFSKKAMSKSRFKNCW